MNNHQEEWAARCIKIVDPILAVLSVGMLLLTCTQFTIPDELTSTQWQKWFCIVLWIVLPCIHFMTAIVIILPCLNCIRQSARSYPYWIGAQVSHLVLVATFSLLMALTAGTNTELTPQLCVNKIVIWITIGWLCAVSLRDIFVITFVKPPHVAAPAAHAAAHLLVMPHPVHPVPMSEISMRLCFRLHPHSDLPVIDSAITPKDKPKSAVPGPQLVCSVCLMNFEPETIVAELQCRHIFHEECIRRWLADKPSCPLCRAPVR